MISRANTAREEPRVRIQPPLFEVTADPIDRLYLGRFGTPNLLSLDLFRVTPPGPMCTRYCSNG